MLLRSEIEEGKIYGYGVDSTFDSLTYTAKAMEVNGDTLTTECQQTKKVETVGRHMLTTIDRCKEMYEAYKKEYDNMDNSDLDKHGKWKVERKYKRLKKILEFVNSEE